MALVYIVFSIFDYLAYLLLDFAYLIYHIDCLCAPIESESTDLNFALNTMALSEESIPKLYPSSTPLSNGNDRNPTVIQATSTPPPPPPPALPDISTSTPIETPWYYKRSTGSESEEEEEDTNNGNDDYDDYYQDDGETIQKTPSPNKLKGYRFNNQLDFASTPLNPSCTLSFSSPMNKLNQLHLESQLDMDGFEEEHLIEQGEEEEEEDDDDDDEYSLGNKTITTHESESESEQGESNEINIKHFEPKYISSRRKRLHLESPDMMVLTPNVNYKNNVNDKNDVNDITYGNDMSICNTTSTTTNTTATNTSAFKFSFSNISDSTPCPRQPKRKRLKFKHELTRNILDLNYAKKSILSQPLSFPLYNDGGEGELPNEKYCYDNDDENNSGISSGSTDNKSINSKLESTPISQSTPASLRASSPPPLQQQQQQKPRAQPQPQPQQTSSSSKSGQEYGETINGYKFVKPKNSMNNTKLPQFKYETPINNNRYHQLCQGYNSNNYQIMNELPVTAAGLMPHGDEDDDDIHIGDRRIGDPYLNLLRDDDNHCDQETHDDGNQLREIYFKENRLPLPTPYFYQLKSLSVDQILALINYENLLKFYETILNGDETLYELLKQERIRWHPDKWIGKLNQKNEMIMDVDYELTIKMVDSISQTINSIIESL